METANQNTESNESTLKNEKPEMEKDLVVWVAPARPFRKRDKQFYVTTISIAGIVCLILFLAEGAMPVILIISLIFLYYVMNTVPQNEIEYKITNKGVKVSGRRTDYQCVGRFWFSTKYDSEILNLETSFIPHRMELVTKPELQEDIRKALKDYLVEETIPPSNLDKAIDWFSKKLPQ